MQSLCCSCSCSMHDLECILAGVSCMCSPTPRSYETALVLPWTPVSPDEFFVTSDAGPRVGVHRASCCGILRNAAFCSVRAQQAPRARAQLPVRSSSPVATHWAISAAVLVVLAALKAPQLASAAKAFAMLLRPIA